MSKWQLMATSNAAAARNAAKLQRAECRQHMSSISTEIPSVPSAVRLEAGMDNPARSSKFRRQLASGRASFAKATAAKSSVLRKLRRAVPARLQDSALTLRTLRPNRRAGLPL